MLPQRLRRVGRHAGRIVKNGTNVTHRASLAAGAAVAQKVLPVVPEMYDSMDGNTAAAYVAYAMSEVSFIFPISPATSMGELMDTFASAGIKNVVTDSVVDVEVMQSEGGAAGACHGALHGGSLASTFTASQGLLLMIPNLYLIAGELIPTVFHISARTVAKHALSIYNDHSDVMACRQCGWAMLASNDAQEVMDLGLIAHMSTLKAKVPFMHFFDGNRTSGEIKKIKRIPYESIKEWVPRDLVKKNLRDESLNPQTPLARGVGQRPDVFMQHSVSSQKYYEAAPGIVQEVMDEFKQMTGRGYNLFDYFGDPNAERVIVSMGSSGMTVEQVVNNFVAAGEKVGGMNVRLYRPWSAEHFLAALPKTCKRIAVLDKTREDGALASPLFLDSAVTIAESDREGVKLIGGQYGLSSKEFTPPMVEAVYAELLKENPKKRFTIGIKDDVTHTSLDYSMEKENTVPVGTTQCVFWGLGSDGTVGANKEAIKMIGENTDMFTQGHFVYDSKKSGGVTVSHLRFGKDPIRAEYLIQNADFVGCHNWEYPRKFNVLSQLKAGGTFALNTPFADNREALLEGLPNKFKREMARLGGKFYAIDAQGLAMSLGLGPRINMVMTSVFYQLSGVLPVDEALSLLKDSIKKVYGKKGDKVVKMNYDAVDLAVTNLVQIEVDQAWLDLPDDPLYPPLFDGDKNPSQMTDFVKNIMMPAMMLEAEDIPVSAFRPGGVQEVGTTMYERRGFAPEIPIWKPDPCTQCNYCALVCPHGVIRPFLMDKKVADAGPSDYKTRKAQGGGDYSGKQFSIQVAPMDCTGCAVCSQACPDDALVMTRSSEILENGKTVMADQLPHWEYSFALPNNDRIIDKFTVKGSQFQQPLLEFSCACSGCGETPYAKLLTQLFGQNLVIANASGCSSVWGGTALTHPYTTHKESKRGPAWGRSLFEDNAEYGYGMAKAGMARRKAMKQYVTKALSLDEDKMSPELTKNLQLLLKNWDDMSGKANDIVDTIMPMLANEYVASPTLEDIWAEKDVLNPFANWLLGGDGWAYDIGFGGLAHVLSKGDNINILVMDTEQYSNTGGQSSKSTNKGTMAKFDSLGKSTNKMNLGEIARSYGNVYVASIAMGANYNQSVQAFKEAQEYQGTSIIMAYSPCIDWGFDMQYMMDFQKAAVDTGYYQLFRYDPRKETPMQMDSKKIRANVDKYLGNENRFARLQREQTERADKLHGELQEFTEIRHKRLLRQSMSDLELLDFLKKQIGEQTGEKLTVLYGSETGNAAEAAEMLKFEFSRRDMRAQVVALDDFDVEELAELEKVVLLVATCGQGEMPANCKSFYSDLMNPDLPTDLLAKTKISVFGLGDTHYVYFNEAAKMYENRLKELGATNFMDTVFGDDQDDDRWETAFETWTPDLFNSLGLAEPEKKLMPSSYAAELVNDGDVPERYTPTGATMMEVYDNTKLTPETYDRDTRHYRVNIEGKTSYELGDALGVYATNPEWKVDPFLHFMSMDGTEVVQFNDQNSERKDPLPEFLTTRQLFTEVMDVFGKPKRRFYELLELTAEDDGEREAIAHMLSPEGATDFRAMVDETVDHMDLLAKFPSCKPSLSYLLDYIPRIKPRLYSIASSPNELPDAIEMCIVVDDWDTPGGRKKEGLCSRFMTTTKKDEPSQLLGSLMGKVNGGVLGEPEHDKPIILAALGTGLAPVRGIVRDRIHAWNNGITTGPMSMYFGARHKKNEYLYEDEWESWIANYTPGFEANLAWSRDQEHKIYIQDKIMEQPQQMYDYLVRDEGYFYACGSSAVNDLKGYVAKCISDIDPVKFPSEEVALEYLTDLQVKGRYNVESW